MCKIISQGLGQGRVGGCEVHRMSDGTYVLQYSWCFFCCAKVKNCRNGVGRNCSQVFTNNFRNYVKTRNLTIEMFGRKYVKNFADGIAVSEKITTFTSH